MLESEARAVARWEFRNYYYYYCCCFNRLLILLLWRRLLLLHVRLTKSSFVVHELNLLGKPDDLLTIRPVVPSLRRRNRRCTFFFSTAKNLSLSGFRGSCLKPISLKLNVFDWTLSNKVGVEISFNDTLQSPPSSSIRLGNLVAYCAVVLFG